MYKPLYKKIDMSALDGYVAIPNDLKEDFLAAENLPISAAREVKIIWGRKKYAGYLRHARPKNPYLMLRYEQNRDLLKKIRETFIYSYVVFKSKKEEADLIGDKQFRSRLEKGQREVIVIQPVSAREIQLKVFIKIEHEWDVLFRRLAQENVFGWIFNEKSNYLVTESSAWKNIRSFKKCMHKSNVIYYLAHTKKRLLYVGKAEVFGNRVAPGRQHQGMPGDWDKFRYDVIKPEYASLLERIEDHTIRAFAGILQNDKGYSSLNISNYTLVNANWKNL